MSGHWQRRFVRQTTVGLVLLALMLGACSDRGPQPLAPADDVDSVDPPEPPDPRLIAFADSCLEQAIREELEIDEGELTAKDLLQLTRLSTVGHTITDLRGLESCQNLEFLHLMESGISDASHLEVVGQLPRLLEFAVQHSSITTLEGIAGSEILHTLWISSSAAVDLAALADMPTLASLTLSIPNLAALDPVASLPRLTDLCLADGDGPPDLDPVAELTRLRDLTVLCAEGPDDLTPLRGLHDLRWLVLINTTAPDLAPFRSLHRLEFLDLMGGRFHDLTGITDLESLETVALHGAWLLEEAVFDQIPAMRDRGVDVHHNIDLPPEAIGVWSLESILVDGVPVDVAEYLDWPADTVTRVMSIYSSRRCTMTNLAADGEVVRHEFGLARFSGDDEIEVDVREVDGEDVPTYVDFEGTWRVSDDWLILTTASGGEMVEMYWTR